MNPKLLKFKVFSTEEDAKSFVSTWEGEGQLSGITEGKEGKFVIVLPNPVSQSIDFGFKKAVEVTKLKVPLGYEWVGGVNWYQCH